jgi:hypothetical protein
VTTHVALHAADAAAHDYHAGEGSFAGTVNEIAAARRRGDAIAVTTLLTRSSYRGLADLPQFLLVRGVGAWCIAVPAAPPTTPDRLTPRLALALPYALHALELARRLELPAFLRGAPLCLLGPHTGRVLPSPPRAFGPRCEACPARPGCPGVDPAYLARFRGDELVPREAPPRATPPPGAALFADL